MPNSSLQDAIKEAFAIAPSSKSIIHTLEIRQTGVQAPIHIARTHQPITATDENGVDRLYAPVGFQFSLPPSNEEGFRSLNIAVDNVGREVSDFIKTAKTEKVPVEAVYRPYLSDDLTAPQMVPPLILFLKDLQMTGTQVVGRATFMDIVNKKFPSDLYTRERFPSLG